MVRIESAGRVLGHIQRRVCEGIIGRVLPYGDSDVGVIDVSEKRRILVHPEFRPERRPPGEGGKP